MKDNHAALLLSSGLDSVSLLNVFLKNTSRITPVYIQCGFRWEETELYWLKKFLRTLKSGSIEPLAVLSYPHKDICGFHWSVTGVGAPGAKSKPSEMFLPGRNLALLSKGILYCALNNIQTLGIGTSQSYPFEDGKAAFFREMEVICRKSLGRDVAVKTPLLSRGTEEAMYEARELGFEYTFSCVSPKGHSHCGECLKCSERKWAFARSGLNDKTPYYKRHGHPLLI